MPTKRKAASRKPKKKHSKKKTSKKKVSFIPKGYHTVTPYVIVRGAGQLLDFVKRAFGAKEKHRSAGEDGSIWHADIVIGSSHVMIADASEQWPAMQAGVYLYVKDTDAAYKHAIEAGGVSIMEPTDMFYGDRNAGVKDQWGNLWWIGTHFEDVSPKELAKRMQSAKK